MKFSLEKLTESVFQQLLPELQLKSIHPHDPVVVGNIPEPWELLGAGNYAAVLCHQDYPDYVVKIYAPNRPGFEEEVEVYRRLGSHPAYSECFFAEDGILILKRLCGVTLYDCIHRGLRIPKKVIQDIDKALEYARDRNLYPHDIHGRNVMMYQGRGLVVDISDFLDRGKCRKWDNLKTAYYYFYRPILSPIKLPIPYFLLNGVRKLYRMLTSWKKWF
ncbi:serine/threonine protein kinase [Brunnivagina elsteri]|uniref:Serine/threonine protein kinase n=1 Tax=Brunnivagina elsteri CCALA 953 TaxID=987040 RepID=A0A2A2TFW5_9CYAN|nr:serine/threonine protein kinase [Calothrix elsteri]PAX52581.1 serine/threonine protein kinase [Calothrix elsteri CCALA 953]